jgi:hypothetical protein
MKKIIGIVTVLSLVSGCATTDDRQRTQAEGFGIGAIAGAVLGAAVTRATGGDAEAARKAALIGGMVGGAGGALYGNHVANKKAQYASREDYLDACVAEASKARGDAETYNLALQQEVDTLDTRATELLAAIQSGQSRRGELDALRARGQAKLAEAEKTMKDINVELTLQRQVLEEERKGNPAAERLASINNRMSV